MNVPLPQDSLSAHLPFAYTFASAIEQGRELPLYHMIPLQLVPLAKK